MNFELFLVTLAVWFFLARKFSNWSWVSAVTDLFPGPAKSLWKAWMACSFCGGFWIALALRGITGWQTLPGLSRLHVGLDWPLDALATAMLVTIVAIPLEVVGTHMKKLRQEEEKIAGKAGSKSAPPKTPAPRDFPGQKAPEGRRGSGRNFHRRRGPRRPVQKPRS